MTREYGDTDYWLMAAVIILAGLGAVMSYSLSSVASAVVKGTGGDRLFFFKRELLRLALAGVAFAAALRINYRRLRKLILPGLALSMVLLGAALSLGATRGARSWILGLQPTEPARFMLVLFLAHYMDRQRENMQSLLHGYLMALAPIALVAGAIVLQPDFGSALAIGAIGYLMLFAGGANIVHWGIGLAAAASGFAVVAIAKIHVIGRLQGFWIALTRPEMLEALAPSAPGHLRNTLIHTFQALLGIGSGGLFGVGLGQSRQKLLFISEPHTDFVFSIIAEEGGFLITGLILLLYLVILWRGMTIAGQLSDRFERFSVLGLTLSLFIYALINISVNVGLFPITGLPLPFLSYGGSALVVNAASAGLILNMSRHRGERSIQSFSRKRHESNHSRWRDGRTSLSRAGGGRGH